MATRATTAPAPAHLTWRVAERDTVVATYVLGALLLAGQAAVHVQQYVSIFHDVRWIGPLFLGDAAACAVSVIGLAFARTRRLAALLGIAVSVGALGGLVLSYGRGLFGWQEAGFRAPVAWALGTEVAAAIVLAGALAGFTWSTRR